MQQNQEKMASKKVLERRRAAKTAEEGQTFVSAVLDGEQSEKMKD